MTDAGPDLPAEAAHEWPPPPPGSEWVPWRRLDPRMLLVHPVLETIKFLPVLIGVFVLGSGAQGFWQLIGVAFPVGLGLLRFFTTQFRITPTQIELQRGLLSRNVLTARLDRVRAVELTSTPVHRILGLAKVQIGTASAAKDNDERFVLDSLPVEEARQLRVSLLHRADVTSEQRLAKDAPIGGSDVISPAKAAFVPPSAEDDEILMKLNPAWARYAPLTTSGSVIAAAMGAVFGQFTDRIGQQAVHEKGTIERIADVPILLLVGGSVVVFLVVGAVFGVLGYWVTNGGFTLSRDAKGRTFHIRRGLLTSRETSLEVGRVRGLHVGEPLGLRLVGAARLSAIVTGVSKKEAGSTLLVPPAPRGVVAATGTAVLQGDEALEIPLVRHGWIARRRRWTRAMAAAVIVPVVVGVVCATTSLPWWAFAVSLLLLPIGGLVAEDRYRRLGHALATDHLVVRSGTFNGRRNVLQRTGIIGWNLQQSWFQRRAGVVTLVATTAAGAQAYAAIDVPESMAIALAHEAVPGLVEPFLA